MKYPVFGLKIQFGSKPECRFESGRRYIASPYKPIVYRFIRTSILCKNALSNIYKFIWGQLRDNTNSFTPSYFSSQLVGFRAARRN